MKVLRKGFLATFFLLVSFSVFSQSSLGWTNQESNLRSGPGANFEIVKTLPAETQILIFSLDGENDYYKVKHIETDTDGYILKSLIKLDENAEKNKPNKKSKKPFWLDQDDEGSNSEKSFWLWELWPNFIKEMVAKGFWWAIIANIIVQAFLLIIGTLLSKVDKYGGWGIIVNVLGAIFPFYIWHVRGHKGWLIFAIILAIFSIFALIQAIKKLANEKD